MWSRSAKINDCTIYHPSLSGVRRAEGVSADDRDICPTPDGPNASKPAVQPHRHCAGCGRWLPLTLDGRILVHDAGFSGEGPHRWPNQTKIESFQESGATLPSPSSLVSDGVHRLLSPVAAESSHFPLPASVLGEGSRGSGLDRPLVAYAILGSRAPGPDPRAHRPGR
jgi:hypothetical protein